MNGSSHPLPLPIGRLLRRGERFTRPDPPALPPPSAARDVTRTPGPTREDMLPPGQLWSVLLSERESGPGRWRPQGRRLPEELRRPPAMLERRKGTRAQQEIADFTNRIRNAGGPPAWLVGGLDAASSIGPGDLVPIPGAVGSAQVAGRGAGIGGARVIPGARASVNPRGAMPFEEALKPVGPMKSLDDYLMTLGGLGR